MYGYQLFSSMNSTKVSSIITTGGWWAYTTSTLLPMQQLSAKEGGGLIIRHGHIIRIYVYRCVCVNVSACVHTCVYVAVFPQAYQNQGEPLPLIIRLKIKEMGWGCGIMKPKELRYS